MFGASALGTNTTFGAQPAQAAAPVNPNKDYEVASPPDDTVSALKFSPATMAQNFLVAGSWDSSVSTFSRHLYSKNWTDTWFLRCAGSMLGGGTDWQNRAEADEDHGRTSAGRVLVRCEYYLVHKD